MIERRGIFVGHADDLNRLSAHTPLEGIRSWNTATMTTQRGLAITKAAKEGKLVVEGSYLSRGMRRAPAYNVLVYGDLQSRNSILLHIMGAPGR